jgi:DNA-binding LacI/PurR family transcriptional regulator
VEPVVASERASRGRSVGRRLAVMMDVARLAGVSHQTVSRVLNDHPNVRAETRERVLSAMRELDYQPNSAARTLVTRRSNTLGIVTLDSTLFGPASMVYGIEQAARAAGWFVTIASVNSLAGTSVVEAVNRLREQGVEGIIAIVPKDSGLSALSSLSLDLPLVGVGAGRAGGIPTVGVDNTAGAAAATRHLLELGHRTVHHIAGPAGWPESRQRSAGWRATLKAAGAVVPEILVGDWSARAGYEMGQRLARDRTVTAIFCANDHTALGALRAVSEVGRRVPDDVSVVGFDDIPEAPFMIPPLTTVRQDFGEVSRRSMALLLDLTGSHPRAEHGEGASPDIRLAPHLVVRDSSGPRIR